MLWRQFPAAQRLRSLVPAPKWNRAPNRFSEHDAIGFGPPVAAHSHGSRSMSQTVRVSTSDHQSHHCRQLPITAHAEADPGSTCGGMGVSLDPPGCKTAKTGAASRTATVVPTTGWVEGAVALKVLSPKCSESSRRYDSWRRRAAVDVSRGAVEEIAPIAPQPRFCYKYVGGPRICTTRLEELSKDW